MTKIIFDYNVYYISDKDTFSFEHDMMTYTPDNKTEHVIMFKIYSDGKTIVDILYKCGNETELENIILFFNRYVETDIDKNQFNIQFIKNGGCSNK